MNERVADDVGEDLTEAILVSGDDDRTVELRRDRALWVDSRGVAGGVGDELAEVDRPLLQRAPLVELGEAQQIVDEPAHAHRLLLGPAHRFVELVAIVQPADAVELGVAADGRHRCPQLMARVGDEAPQPLLRLGSLGERLVEVVEHLIERDAELPGLGRRRRVRDSVGEVATRDLLRRVRHLLDRTNAESHHPPGDSREEQQHDAGGDHFQCDQPGHRVVDVRQRDRRDPEGSVLEVVGPDAVAQVVVAGRRRREGFPRRRVLGRLVDVDTGGWQLLTTRQVRGEERGHLAVGAESALVDVGTALVARRRFAGWTVVDAIGCAGRGQPVVDLVDQVSSRGRRDDDRRHGEGDDDQRDPGEDTGAQRKAHAASSSRSGSCSRCRARS